MSKRSAEQALRDELADAEKALELANARAETARLRVVEAEAARTSATDRRTEASERVTRAQRALLALVPLPIEPETTPNVVEPTPAEAGQVEEVAVAASSAKTGGRRGSA